MNDDSGVTVGGYVTLDIGKIVHGGHCLGYETGPRGSRTYFVRHAIPGEVVRARVTDKSSKVIRADAVEVLASSSHRVSAPCSFSGPGGCGGCDFQHVSLEHQRALKEQVLHESLDRFADLDSIPDCTVHALSDDGLGWRSRVTYAQDPTGGWGLRAYHSHDVIPVDRCLIAEASVAIPGSRVPTLTPEVLGREWRIPPGVFWQPHRLAAQALATCVVDLGLPGTGEAWWDLYSGAGLFSAFLGEAVGPHGHVDAVEASGESVKVARRALHDLPQVRLHRVEVGPWLVMKAGGTPDGVVLDPPRAGAKAGVLRALAAPGPRVVVYVACDPVSLARDARVLKDEGYRLDALQAFDAFPMTHHFETVARFTRVGPPG